MPSMDTATAFTSDGEGDRWVPVSPRLVTARRIVLVVSLVPITMIALGVLTLLGVIAWVSIVIAVAALVGLLWGWWLIGRRVRSYAYCERGDDLLVSSGILFRRLVIVPYGRMQLVDV